MEKRTAIFFTTDKGFLVPTLVASQQILSQTDVMEQADILIFLTAFDDAEFDAIAREFSTEGRSFIKLPQESFQLPEGASFNKTHVPLSTLARLSTGPLIPEKYDRLVYIDGDVQIVDSILPLVQTEMAEGEIYAACDHAYICAPESGKYPKSLMAYIAGLGLDDPRQYFNAGVLAATRKSWIELSDKALKFMQQNSELCRFHDQSALNAVCKTNRKHLSPRFNCVSWYHVLDQIERIKPAILHFTGGAKPWNSDAYPWNGRFRSTYSEFVGQHPSLQAYWSPKEQPKAKRFQLGWILPWRAPLRKRRIHLYLKEQFGI